MSASIGSPKVHEPIRTARLNTLLSQCLTHPLVTIVAGEGFGKTRAVATFVSTLDARVIWLRFSPLDNYTDRFWRNYILATEKSMPELAEQMRRIPFPKTLRDIDHYCRMCAQSIYAENRALLVLDDYENASGVEIRRFITSILEAGFENLCVFLISSAKNDRFFRPAMTTGVPFRVTEEDLTYTDDEIAECLTRNGIDASRATVEIARRETGGWSLAMRALMAHWQNPVSFYTKPQLDLTQFVELFYSKYMMAYPDSIQLLLIKLSILPMFSVEIAAGVCPDCIPEATVVIRTNPFITWDESSEMYTIQNVYRRFLRHRMAMDAEEESRIYYIAGATFLRKGLIFDAIDLFGRAKRYSEVIAAILAYPPAQYDHSAAQAFTAALESMPKAVLDDQPQAKLRYALLLRIARRFGAALDILTPMQAQYADDPIILGEVCLHIAETLLDADIERALSYYRKAARLLPGGSARRTDDIYFPMGKSLITAQCATPEGLASVEKAVREISSLSTTLYRRPCKSWHSLFLAQVAYHTNDPNASKLIQQASYTAMLEGFFDLQANALSLMLRLGMLAGKLEDIMTTLERLDQLLYDQSLYTLRAFQDCILGWFYMRIDSLSNVPRWLTDIALRDSDPPVSERDMILRVQYQLETGNDGRALAMIDAYMPFCQESRYWIGALELWILRGICLSRTGEPDAAMASLLKAYQMAHPSGILTPFIEYGHWMRALVGQIQGRQDHPFDPAWLEMVYTKASTYAKRMSSFKKAYERVYQSDDGTPQRPLTAREQEVLEYLAQGLKYDEMGDLMGISINGVKKHITSLYNKLGAMNRAEAVYIAMSRGMIV